MHLLIISSASSTLKAMRSVSGTGTLPLQRDLLGIFVQRQVDRYMTGQRGECHVKTGLEVDDCVRSEIPCGRRCRGCGRSHGL